MRLLSTVITGYLLCQSMTLVNAQEAPFAFKTGARTKEERLSFQSFDGWSPRTHLDADVAMVYGIDKTLPTRIKTWKDKGFRIHVMTGVAWGEYQDYLFGQFDGRNHEDESQMDRDGKVIGHGVNVPYMSPGESYGKYLCEGVKRAIDAGAEGIHLEETGVFGYALDMSPTSKKSGKPITVLIGSHRTLRQMRSIVPQSSNTSCIVAPYPRFSSSFAITASRLGATSSVTCPPIR